MRIRDLGLTLVLSGLAGVCAAADSGLEGRLHRLEVEAQRARDVQEVQNVMSRRAFYHSIGHNEQELALWAKHHDVRWAQNQGCYVGMASLKVYYDDLNRQMQAADLERLSKLNPAIKNVPENRNIGSMVMHTLTTPVIEIAEDGQTAKAMWYTPGVILSTQDGKTPQGMWMWERYGVDFVREDGQWRIWHAQVNTDFGNPMGQPLGPQGPDAAQQGSEKSGPGPGAAGLKIPPPDQPKVLYREYGPTRVPSLTPPLPQPYRTMSETFEYADCRS